MKFRQEEEVRLDKMSQKTLQVYLPYADDIDLYIGLLRQLDMSCDDAIFDSKCKDTSGTCKCVICNRK